MVEIKYKVRKMHEADQDNEHFLSIKGHAGYAEKGKDIVCSSVSVLAYTLLSMLQKHPEYYGSGGLKYHFEEGNVTILCKAKHFPMSEDMIDEIFETIVCGYELLADNYRDHVKFERI